MHKLRPFLYYNGSVIQMTYLDGVIEVDESMSWWFTFVAGESHVTLPGGVSQCFHENLF